MEIEMKLKVTEEEFKAYLEHVKIIGTSRKEKEQHDIYFSPESPNFFGKEENDECLRIRIQKDKKILSYKKIMFGSTTENIHLIEHESTFEDLDEMLKILEAIHIHEVIRLNKKRISYLYKNAIEISFDIVEELGYFIELEVIDKQMNIKDANHLLMNSIKELGLHIENRDLTGYANALYNLKYREK